MRRRPEGSGRRLCCGPGVGVGVSVSLATRRSERLPGLATAGQAVRLERSACPGSSVAPECESCCCSYCSAGRSTRCNPALCPRASSWWGLLVHDRQGPAPPGRARGRRRRWLPRRRLRRCVKATQRAWPFPVLVIGPCTRYWPKENSLGTSSTNEPMVAPVNRCQSPTSTGRANGASKATAPRAGRSGGTPTTPHARRSAPAPREHDSLAQRKLGHPVPVPHQITPGVLPRRGTGPRASSCCGMGTTTQVTSSGGSSRARAHPVGVASYATAHRPGSDRTQPRTSSWPGLSLVPEHLTPLGSCHAPEPGGDLGGRVDDAAGQHVEHRRRHPEPWCRQQHCGHDDATVVADRGGHAHLLDRGAAVVDREALLGDLVQLGDVAVQGVLVVRSGEQRAGRTAGSPPRGAARRGTPGPRRSRRCRSGCRWRRCA